jgi:hypothetical protein
MRAEFVNYAAIVGAGGNFNLTNSTVYGSLGSCIWMAVPDSTIVGNQINICNGGNIGAAGVEYFGVGTAQHKLSNNSFCNVLNSTNSQTNMVGYRIDTGGQKLVSASNNSYFNCIIQYLDFDQSGTNFDNNPNPPPGPPTIVAGSGGTGLGAGTMALQGFPTDRGGDILLNAGAGAGSTGTVALQFHSAFFPAPHCDVSLLRGSGVWSFGAQWTEGGAGRSPSQFEIQWNNAGVNLTPGAGYFLSYKCSQSNG